MANVVPPPALELSLRLVWDASSFPVPADLAYPLSFNSQLVAPFFRERPNPPINVERYVGDMEFIASIAVAHSVDPLGQRRDIMLRGDPGSPNAPQLSFALRHDASDQIEHCAIAVLPAPTQLGAPSQQYLIAEIPQSVFVADRANTLAFERAIAAKVPEVCQLALGVLGVLGTAASL